MSVLKVLEELRTYFNHLYNEFVNVMVDSGCIISGSFLLTTITNASWKANDLDIYMDYNHKTTSKIERFLKYVSNDQVEELTTCYKGDQIMSVKQYYYRNLTIQLIQIDPEFGACNHILKTYDLGILKNYLSFEANKIKLYIHHPDMIKSNESDITIIDGSSIKRVFNRILKYKQRGIKFTTDLVDVYVKMFEEDPLVDKKWLINQLDITNESINKYIEKQCTNLSMTYNELQNFIVCMISGVVNEQYLERQQVAQQQDEKQRKLRELLLPNDAK